MNHDMKLLMTIAWYSFSHGNKTDSEIPYHLLMGFPPSPALDKSHYFRFLYMLRTFNPLNLVVEFTNIHTYICIYIHMYIY